MMLTTENEIRQWLTKNQVQDFIINEDLTVDVYGDVNLQNKKLTFLPVQFGKVTQSFFCQNNQLISLKGTPKEVGKLFDCSDNILTTLENGPQKVKVNYNAKANPIVSLQGFTTLFEELFIHDLKKYNTPIRACDNHYTSEGILRLYCHEINMISIKDKIDEDLKIKQTSDIKNEQDKKVKL